MTDNTDNKIEVPSDSAAIPFSKRLEALQGGSMSTQELADYLGKSANQVRVRCNELKDAGKVIKVHGTWGLPLGL